jgi:hypothetical protein
MGVVKSVVPPFPLTVAGQLVAFDPLIPQLACQAEAIRERKAHFAVHIVTALLS